MTLGPVSFYVLQTALAVSLLIAIILIIRRPFAKRFGAQAAYMLWALPVLRMVMPPLPAKWTLFGLWPRAETSTGLEQQIAPGLIVPPSVPVQFDASLVEAVLTQPASPGYNIMDIAVTSVYVIWIIGMIATLALFYVRQISFSNESMKTSHDAGSGLQHRADNLKMTIGLERKPIPVRTSLSCQSPLVTGLFNPVILVPETFERDYTIDEQNSALSHELMHTKRYDLWSLLVAIHITALQWFNPLAWMALKAFRSDQEAACDADVLSLGNTNRQTYGATLVKAARLSHARTQPMLSPSLPLNHALYERLDTMTNPLPSAQRRTTANLLTAILGSVALIASAGVSSAAQEADDTKSVKTIITQSQTESIIVKNDNGEVNIVIDGRELSPAEVEEYLARNGDGVQTIRIQRDGGPVELKGKRVLFLGATDSPPDATAFAKEMRRLAQDPVINADAMSALAEDFETRMTTWSEDREELLEQHVVRLEGETEALEHGVAAFSWASDAEPNECGDQMQIRTVVIEKDDGGGQETRSVNVECTSLDGFDVDTLIAQLETNADLTEERLEELRKQLENLELGTSGEKVRIKVAPQNTED